MPALSGRPPLTVHPAAALWTAVAAPSLLWTAAGSCALPIEVHRLP